MLTSCSDCGRKISVSAKACPSCGNTYRSPGRESHKDVHKMTISSLKDGLWFREMDADMARLGVSGARVDLERCEEDLRRSKGNPSLMASRDAAAQTLAEAELKLTKAMQRVHNQQQDIVGQKIKYSAIQTLRFVFQFVLAALLLIFIVGIFAQ